MYALLLQKTKWNKQELLQLVLKILKGVSKLTVKENIKFEAYKECLFKSITTFQKYMKIQSKRHKVMTIQACKKALSSFDDK